MVESCRCWGNGGGSSSPAKPPHFFKIITSVGVEDQKLMVPIKFAKRYGETLSNPVFLKVPNGEVWEVELTNSEGHFWLQNGWKEFKEHYSVCFGHLLVFRYHGNSHFHVLIFDTSASEVEYPLTNPHAGIDDENWQTPETKDIERDESVEIMDDIRACDTKGKTNSIPDSGETGKDVSVEIFEEGSVEMESSEEVAFVEFLNDPPTCPRKRKRNSVPASSNVPSRRSARTNLSPEKENASNLHDYHSAGNYTRDVTLQNSDGDAKPSHLIEVKKEFSEVMPTAQGHLQSRSRMPAKRQSKAMDRKLRFLQRAADSFKSKNPFFMVYMPPTYVYGTEMHIPVDFARKYIGYKKSNVTLRTADGRTWSSTCSYSRMTRFANKLAWFSFARDNNINVGDVCVFEMIKSTEPSFNVVIFRAAAAD